MKEMKSPRAIDHDAVLAAVDRMTVALRVYLPTDVAIERSRNIAVALSDGVEDTERTIIELLGGCTADLTLGERALVIVDTRDAWLRGFAPDG